MFKMCIRTKDKWLFMDLRSWTFTKNWKNQGNTLQNQKIVIDKKVRKNAWNPQKCQQKYVKKEEEYRRMVEMHKGGGKVCGVFVQSYKFATCGGKIAKNG